MRGSISKRLFRRALELAGISRRVWKAQREQPAGILVKRQKREYRRQFARVLRYRDTLPSPARCPEWASEDGIARIMRRMRQRKKARRVASQP